MTNPDVELRGEFSFDEDEEWLVFTERLGPAEFGASEIVAHDVRRSWGPRLVELLNRDYWVRTSSRAPALTGMAWSQPCAACGRPYQPAPEVTVSGAVLAPILDRIADALERIADALSTPEPGGKDE